MSDFISWLVPNAGWIIETALMVVGGAAVVATQTPNKADDQILQFVLNLINSFGANVGQAKNQE